MNPPYLVIAEALRDRIESGSLAPGARVPSTRRIVAEWGVAMATATKALAELRHQGLVRVVPGVGTVVADPRRDAESDRSASDPDLVVASRREPIVRCAVRLADTEGLDAVTMRRIAAELEVAPMSLYRHVASKEDLLLLMREATFGELALPDEPSGTWRRQLELSVTALWSLYRRHPWLARTSSLTRPHPGPHQLRYSEWNLRVLTGLGFDTKTVFLLHLTLFNLVHGSAASIEVEMSEQSATGVDNDRWIRRRTERAVALIGSGPYPHSAAVFLGGAQDLDLDELFATGLAAVLDGIEHGDSATHT